MTVRFDDADSFSLTCKVGVVRTQKYILANFPNTVNSGCVTTDRNDGGGLSEHNEGRAGDTGIRPIGSPSGDAVVSWLYSNREALGCQCIIYRGRIYSSNNGEGWHPYTKNRHDDHIHWELNWDGARALTPWFTGQPAPPSPPTGEDDMFEASDRELLELIAAQLGDAGKPGVLKNLHDTIVVRGLKYNPSDPESAWILKIRDIHTVISRFQNAWMRGRLSGQTEESIIARNVRLVINGARKTLGMEPV